MDYCPKMYECKYYRMNWFENRKCRKCKHRNEGVIYHSWKGDVDWFEEGDS